MRTLVADISETLLKLTDRLDWLAPLAMRLGFGYFWLETGWAKLHNLDGFTERFVSWGLPFPAFSAGLSAWTELLGGGLIMLGLLTRLVSIPMLINMVVAIAFVVIKDVTDVDSFFELDEVLYILIFGWLIMAGPGKVSVDTLILKWLGLDKRSTLRTAHQP